MRNLRILFIIVLLNSCNFLSKEIQFTNLGFGNEIDVLQNLDFEFNEDLMYDADLDKWETTPYIEFSPKIEGKFKWLSKRHVVFSPAHPLPLATKYKAKLSKYVLKRKSKDFVIDKEDEVSFATQNLKIEESQMLWTRTKENKNEARLYLRLNGNYDKHSIQSDLNLYSDGEKLDYKVANSLKNELILDLESVNAYEALNLNTQINAVANKYNRFAKSENFDLKLEPGNTLEIYKIKTSFKKLKGYIHVSASQQINIKEMAQNIKIEPEVKYNLEKTENGFVIQGDFNQETLYKLTINKNLVGVLGGKMDEDYIEEAYFGEVNPYIEFTNLNAQYLSSLGNRNIGINIVNVPKVTVSLRKVYANNILDFLRNSRQYYMEDDSREYYFSGNAENYSDEVYNKKYETAGLPLKQGVNLLNIPMPNQKKQKGIYFVSVQSEDENYLKSEKLLSISDLGLIVKQSNDGNNVSVFVNSIINTSSLKDVTIKLISNKNQEIAHGLTNQNGVLEFKNLNLKQNNQKIALIIGETGEDFNYLYLEESLFNTSKFDLNGRMLTHNEYDGFIYGDREIYRPGETINFNAVIRTTQWDTPKQLPVKIKIKQPNGRELHTFSAFTNANGAISHSVELDRAAITGHYDILIYTGDDVLIASKSISVEEFMPDRIKVQLKADSIAKLGENLALNIKANHLFGPPAAESKYEVEYSIYRKPFQPKGYENFNFGIQDKTEFTNEVRNGVTDKNGMVIENFKMEENFKNKGVLEGKFHVTVFDENSRPVHRIKTFEIYTQEHFFGINIPSYFVGTRSPSTLEFAALNFKGQPVNTQADVEVYLLEYQTILEQTDNGMRYVSKKREKLLYETKIKFGNKVERISFIPRISGSYEVRIKKADGESYVSNHFYAYGSGDRASFEVETDGVISIETDKTEYLSTDKVKAILKAPFDGKMLITLENNGVIEYRYVNTQNKSAMVEFNLGEKTLPNVFISATLLRSMDNTELPLLSAHGYKNVAVKSLQRSIPISIDAPENVRSKTKQTINVKTRPNCELTISVVDEGILQIKNTPTPDIHRFFYQDRTLGVNSYDLYPMLLPEIKFKQNSNVGGDGGLSNRVNPLANGRAELVAKWSGIVKADANGNASFSFDIPEFLGNLRISVVAYNEKSFGSSEKSMIVKDPISLSVGLPMFLSPGDQVIVPFTLFNTTLEPISLDISHKTEGSINALKLSNSAITVQPGQEYHSEINVQALESIGLGKLILIAKSKTETFSKTTEISVRPASSLHKSYIAGTIDLNKSPLFIAPDDYLASSLSSKVYISPLPMMKFTHRLNDLLNYPHGCLEQTISTAFPQLYLADLIENLNPEKNKLEKGNSDRNPRFNVMQALNKLQDMQRGDGGLPYWSGGTESNWWGSIYALHFALEAQKAGFQVKQSFIDNLIPFINGKLNGYNEENQEKLYFMVNNKYNSKTRIPTEVYYSLYVLSMSDKPNVEALNLQNANLNKVDNEHRYLLACAYKNIGDNENFYKILPRQLEPTNYDRMLNGSFSSPIRAVALTLNALIETDPNNLQITKLSDAINNVLSNRSIYLNTQELAFSLSAMGKIIRSKANSNAKAEIFVNNVLVKTIDKKGEWIDLTKYPKGIKVKSTGDKMYFYQENEGIKLKNNFVPEDHFIQIRRTYYDRNGEIIKAPNFKQNQLIVVKLSFSLINNLEYNIDNVVITDLLPSGLQIENPRLVEDRDLTWIKDASEPDFYDIRDDRINYFANATEKTQNYYYLARAINKGVFVQGPVSADAMYNNAIRSYSGAGKVIIN